MLTACATKKPLVPTASSSENVSVVLHYQASTVNEGNYAIPLGLHSPSINYSFLITSPQQVRANTCSGKGYSVSFTRPTLQAL